MEGIGRLIKGCVLAFGDGNGRGEEGEDIRSRETSTYIYEHAVANPVENPK